jgi:hypothetical protein
MSIFDGIASAVSSVAHAAADVVGGAAKTAANLAEGVLSSGAGNLALSALGIAFPPLGIATSLSNAITGVVGQAVNGAAQSLAKEAGMPKFLLGGIGDVVKQVMGQLTQPSHPQCDHGVGQAFGGDLKSLLDDMIKSITDHAKKIMDDCGGDQKGPKGKGGKQGAGSWLEAIAIAMGKAAGEQASKMVTLSNKLSDLSTSKAPEGASKEQQQQFQADQAKEMNTINSQFQAASQMFNMLQSAFSNAVKSIGEGVTTMARKG